MLCLLPETGVDNMRFPGFILSLFFVRASFSCARIAVFSKVRREQKQTSFVVLLQPKIPIAGWTSPPLPALANWPKTALLDSHDPRLKSGFESKLYVERVCFDLTNLCNLLGSVQNFALVNCGLVRLSLCV